MMFMNEYDIENAVARHAADTIPGRAARFLQQFRDEVNAHSDGWPYWKAPLNAARQMMKIAENTQYLGVRQSTEADYKKALGAIRAFYTRRGTAAGMRWPEGF